MDNLHIVFDGPPGPTGGRFIECETPDGRSRNAGNWNERPDGLWELVIPVATYSKGEPEYLMGQTVWYELKAEIAGETLSKWTGFTVVGCQMLSDTQRRCWNYDLSRDPPDAYHYGTVHFRGVPERELRASNPMDGA